MELIILVLAFSQTDRCRGSTERSEAPAGRSPVAPFELSPLPVLFKPLDPVGDDDGPD